MVKKKKVKGGIHTMKYHAAIEKNEASLNVYVVWNNP